jgi:hypothetical protein
MKEVVSRHASTLEPRLLLVCHADTISTAEPLVRTAAEVLSLVRLPHSIFVEETAVFQGRAVVVTQGLAAGRIDAKASESTHFPAMITKHWLNQGEP